MVSCLYYYSIHSFDMCKYSILIFLLLLLRSIFLFNLLRLYPQLCCVKATGATVIIHSSLLQCHWNVSCHRPSYEPLPSPVDLIARKIKSKITDPAVNISLRLYSSSGGRCAFDFARWWMRHDAGGRGRWAVGRGVPSVRLSPHFNPQLPECTVTLRLETAVGF